MSNATNDKPKCQLCGEPMPPGEEMFNFHGYSGPCPKPPLPATTVPGSEDLDRMRYDQLAASLELDTYAQASIPTPILMRMRRAADVIRLLARSKSPAPPAPSPEKGEADLRAACRSLIAHIGESDNGYCPVCHADVVHGDQHEDDCVLSLAKSALATPSPATAGGEGAKLSVACGNFSTIGMAYQRDGLPLDTVVSIGRWTEPRETGIPGVKLPEFRADYQVKVGDFVKVYAALSPATVAAPSSEKAGGT